MWHTFRGLPAVCSIESLGQGFWDASAPCTVRKLTLIARRAHAVSLETIDVSAKSLALIGTLAIIYLGLYLSRRSEKGFRIFLWIVGTAVTINTVLIVAVVTATK